MNQQILINDDFHFNKHLKAWSFTGIYSGNLLIFIISQSENIQTITQAVKFDWEAKAEEWFEENELDEETTIYLTHC